MSFESKNAIYRLGHFYDIVSNKRIQLADETQVCMVAKAGGFQEAVSIGSKPEKLRTADQLEAEIKAFKGFISLEKFAPAGTFLYFSLSRGKHKFKVELLEDLYLYNCINWKNPEDFYFYECACQVTENLNNSLSSFEPVFGTSISDLYKTAYIHYLQNSGNPARNAISVFFWDKELNHNLEDKKNEIKARHLENRGI